ncbi:hypothetical protein CURTO8I2_170109 [Curtobacterium sp. 8I-2]|nr:hypothetical protein CURTO8I2_170109 [Curtobacterium sp. 8I-2]
MLYEARQSTTTVRGPYGHTASLGSSGTYLPVKEGPNAHGVRHL